ncbi:hypothetical protein H6G33_03840 [Calothrix sp. FACHB-1219]|nr:MULTISPECIES: hypothetical protein [unclassified Calothrix]MBD2207912.1 hypothetical protein [Calothrix sp. FACHB-168]MBD2216162.1 hypothetical protein [Calothrix sp. FACHB-1219]
MGKSSLAVSCKKLDGANMSIILTSEQEKIIQNLLSTGKFNNASTGRRK